MNECKKVFTNLIRTNGKLRNIVKDIKNNKLSKNKTNTELNNLSIKIKNNILNKGEITNKSIRLLINNRINQLLKTVIYSMIDF